MTEPLYSIEFARLAPPGSRERFIRRRIWNVHGADSLVPLAMAHDVARGMAESTKCGARVMDKDQEIARYLYRDGEVIEVTR